MGSAGAATAASTAASSTASTSIASLVLKVGVEGAVKADAPARRVVRIASFMVSVDEMLIVLNYRG